MGPPFSRSTRYGLDGFKYEFASRPLLTNASGFGSTAHPSGNVRGAPEYTG